MFHVTTSGSGTVKWQQVSEDLVPVNIACVGDDPQLVFHITAYNSQVRVEEHLDKMSVYTKPILRLTRFWT